MYPTALNELVNKMSVSSYAAFIKIILISAVHLIKAWEIKNVEQVLIIPCRHVLYLSGNMLC